MQVQDLSRGVQNSYGVKESPASGFGLFLSTVQYTDLYFLECELL